MADEARGVRFELQGAVGHIVLDRPHTANVFDLPAAYALRAAINEAANLDVRVVALTGRGKRFCAGGDVASFVHAKDRPSYLQRLATELEADLRRLSELPKPVVAGVHGAVAGAGLAFVLNSDLIVAGRGTKFAFAYPGIGLTPDCGVSYLLPRVVGQQRALEMALSGRVLTAEAALTWGLVTELVDDDLVAARTAELAAEIATGPVGALSEATRLIRSSWEASRAENAEDEARTIARMSCTAESKVLIERFVRHTDR